MKKKLALISIILSTVLLAVISVMTVIRISQLGTRPVAPSAPESKPGASSLPTLPASPPSPNSACQLNFTVPTPTPCLVKIKGRVYHDRSNEAPYRVSQTEEFGPVSFRVDYGKETDSGFPSRASATLSDCGGTLGSFSTPLIVSGKYKLRLVLNNANWVVTEAYVRGGGASCLNNKDETASSRFGFSGFGTTVGYVSAFNLGCSDIEIWFGVREKSQTTPIPTSTLTPTATITPSTSPTPTATGTIAPSATATPQPTNTPAATNTPEPTPGPGEPYCDYLTASPLSGRSPLNVVFRGRGVDPNGIKGYRFIFGDGGRQEITGSYNSDHIQEVSHTYEQAGSYQAYLEIMDSGGEWRSSNGCRVTISVSGLAQGPTNPPATPRPTRSVAASLEEPTPTEATLPEAGIKIPTLGAILVGFLLISFGAVLVF